MSACHLRPSQYANRGGRFCPLYALVTLISQPLLQRQLHGFYTCHKLCKLCAANDTRYSLGKPRYWACPVSSVRYGAYLFSLWIPYSLEPPLFYTSSIGVAACSMCFSPYLTTAAGQRVEDLLLCCRCKVLHSNPHRRRCIVPHSLRHRRIWIPSPVQRLW